MAEIFRGLFLRISAILGYSFCDIGLFVFFLIFAFVKVVIFFEQFRICWIKLGDAVTVFRGAEFCNLFGFMRFRIAGKHFSLLLFGHFFDRWADRGHF